MIIFLAIMFGFNLPLTAVLLLWVNMVTDGAPALAYSRDPYGKNIMKQKPRPHSEHILPWKKLMFLVFLGIIGTAIALTLFWYTGGNVFVEDIHNPPYELLLAQTMVFNFIVLYELILTYAIRRGYNVPVFSNPWLYLAIFGSVALQALIMYTPLNSTFEIVPLGWNYIGLLAIAGAVFYVAGVIYHLFERVAIKNKHSLFQFI